MQVGQDSYVTVAEADAHISGHYRSTSAARTRWSALSVDDKAVLLVNACTGMEQLPYQGRKALSDQPLAFPRLPAQYSAAQEAPANVKAAQIELALWLSDDAKQAEHAQRLDLQEQGVKSFSLGDLSESYSDKPRPTSIVLSCAKVKTLLARYLSGGYTTC